ncbi:MAG: penicillin-binding protein [Myxococcota bacterium]|nr:penicillin-binding protein [Myxococcota bacterium]
MRRTGARGASGRRAKRGARTTSNPRAKRDARTTSSPRATQERRVRTRVTLIQLALVAAFLGLAARAAQLSVFDERGGARGIAQIETVMSLSPERGGIFDRGGNELALAVAAPSAYAIPGALEDRGAAARKLAGALDIDPQRVANRLRGRDRFVFLARWITSEQAERVRALDLPGVGIVTESRRSYPTGPLAAHLVGFANIDGDGVRGIEQAENAWLRGTPRRLPVERDGSGQLLVNQGGKDWSTAGGDVALTLDVAMQSAAMAALADAIARTGARSGVVVSLDPRTGDVLALAEAPSFDPNHFRKLRFSDTRSRAFLDALEPGSTFKAFLVAAALEHSTVTPEELIDCEQGTFRVPGKTITDHHPYGELSPGGILRVSSNIGAVKLAFALGPRNHLAMLRRFGFGAPTGSGFPDESAGVLRTISRNRPVDHATLAFGQGTGATPVQLAAAMAVLANDGLWQQPRLVKARRANGQPWQKTQIAPGRRVLTVETARTVLAMLEDVTGPEGTGRRAGLRDLRVAGKTGTAQKWDADAGRYSEDRFISWFVGAVPAEAPRLAIVVALDEPRRPLHTGGSSAAPVFARVAAEQLARFGIVTEPKTTPRRKLPETRIARAATEPPKPRPVRTHAPSKPVPEVTRLLDRVLLPDLRGLTVDQVRTVTAKTELMVHISGKGRAVAQDPPPGTVISDRAPVSVRFEPGADSI